VLRPSTERIIWASICDLAFMKTRKRAEQYRNSLTLVISSFGVSSGSMHVWILDKTKMWRTGISIVILWVVLCSFWMSIMGTCMHGFWVKRACEIDRGWSIYSEAHDPRLIQLVKCIRTSRAVFRCHFVQYSRLLPIIHFQIPVGTWIWLSGV
jgi:hypothetical protein